MSTLLQASGAIVRRVFGRITELLTTQSNVMATQLRITGATWARRVRSALMQPSNDWSRPDYDYWRKAYHCRVRGLELSGTFLKPLVSKITSWTLGMGVGWKAGNDAAQTALDDWWTAHHAEIMRAMRASLKQGDGFLVINADLSVTLLPPDSVDPIVADDDYGKIVGWRVTQVLAHPETPASRMIVTDEYYADRRVQTTERPGSPRTERTFPNLLGRSPFVHIANAVDEGETFGHPEAEALVELLQRYNTVLEAAIEGNERQGRPTPVLTFDAVENYRKFWEQYASNRTYTLPDGTTETVAELDVDLNDLLTVVGADFKYASPGSFTGDTSVLLGLLFYLLLEHAEIPEFVFGNAIASSQASANTQMPVWERYIEGRRKDAGGWLLEVAEIVLAYSALVAPGVSQETPTIQWRKLTDDGALTLQVLAWAFSEGLLDERTALMLAPIEVTSVDEILAAAREERAQRMAEAAALLPDNTPVNPDQNGDNPNGLTQGA